jgi:hypothetical protein
LTDDERYALEFIEQMKSWMAENPPEIGVNWNSSMEISIRSVSMIFAYYLFKDSKSITQKFWNEYITTLYYSGVHIEQNQEVRITGMRNNHHLTNVAAMTWLGLFFGDYNRRTSRWLRQSRDDLHKEMEYQVNTDGCIFEGSIGYHRLDLEIFMTTSILLNLNHIKLDHEFNERMEKMCEFTMNYTKPNGLAPQFGDSDDGRFCILNGYGEQDMRDHRYLLAIAGEYFDRDDFRKAACGRVQDAIWLLGGIENIMDEPNENPRLTSYDESGFHIIRGGDVFLIIKCGKIGQDGNGGHDHNDQLSIELNVNSNDIIIDPGSYVYTMDMESRQKFRSTECHNVSQYLNYEQNIIRNLTKEDLFLMYSSNPGVCEVVGKNGQDKLRFEGQVSIAGTDIKYRRSIEVDLKNKRLMVDDTLQAGAGERLDGTCRLHLANGCQVKKNNEGTVDIVNEREVVRLACGASINIDSGMVSPSYGVKLPALILSWEFQEKTSFTIQWQV